MIKLDKITIPDKPVCFFKLDFFELACEVRLNDVPVFFDQEGGEAIIEVPINEYILSGLNSININLIPAYGDDGFKTNSLLDLKLCLRNKGDSREIQHTLWHGNYYPYELACVDLDNTKLDQLQSQCSHPYHINNQALKSVGVNSEFEVDLNLPLWKWLSGEDINNNEENFNSLLHEYKKLYEMLKNKELNNLNNYTLQKANEFASAYFLGDDTEGQHLAGLSSIVTNSDQKLNKFWQKGMSLTTFANGRLACIADSDGDGPILYLVGSGNTANVLKLIYYKDSNQNWRLIR